MLTHPLLLLPRWLKDRRGGTTCFLWAASSPTIRAFYHFRRCMEGHDLPRMLSCHLHTVANSGRGAEQVKHGKGVRFRADACSRPRHESPEARRCNSGQ